jgi:hypothetical protein
LLAKPAALARSQRLRRLNTVGGSHGILGRLHGDVWPEVSALQILRSHLPRAGDWRSSCHDSRPNVVRT